MHEEDSTLTSMGAAAAAAGVVAMGLGLVVEYAPALFVGFGGVFVIVGLVLVVKNV